MCFSPHQERTMKSRIIVAALVAAFATASELNAQVCIGLPAVEGQIAVQANLASQPSGPSYGGRLGINFNTDYSLDVGVDRTEHDTGNGTVIQGILAYEMTEYKPPICALFGVRHEIYSDAEGEDRTTTSIPLGLGIGKRLGSARTFALTLFVRPEYHYVLDPPTQSGSDEDRTFWQQLRDRSEGRGTVGLILSTPLLYATGGIEVATRDDFEPGFRFGVGLLF